MVRKRKRFPEVDELVVAQVEKIESNHVYVKLEDYRGNDSDGGHARGMVHISELANKWIKNISNIVREGQRVVLRVLRVNEEKGHIDLSLRRVNNEQQAGVLEEWKFEVKAENLLKLFGDKVGMDLDTVYDKIGFPLYDKYGDFRTAFESIKDEGIKTLDFLDIDDNLKQQFFEIIDANIELQKVTIDGDIELVIYEGDGIDKIKTVFEKVLKIPHDKNTSINLHYIGAPIYRLKIISQNYPDAEKLLKKINKTIESELKGVIHSYKFIRG
ncbi:MAG: translation initiation factor IF-2 subunit alpha [Promethearchaeota archaeon]